MGGFPSSISLGNPQGRNASEFSQKSSERGREQTSWDVVVSMVPVLVSITLNPGIRTGLNFPRETASVVQKMPMSLLQAQKAEGKQWRRCAQT